MWYLAAVSIKNPSRHIQFFCILSIKRNKGNEKIPPSLFVVVLPFQAGPSREPAVNAPHPFAMRAEAGGGGHLYFACLVAIDAACSFAVAASHLHVSLLVLCHSVPFILYLNPKRDNGV